MKAYLASPLGFSEAGRLFYNKEFVPTIAAIGFEILDPWAPTPDILELIVTAISTPFGPEQKVAWEKADRAIGEANQAAIKACDILIAVLDGTDIDSGTASEIGFAAGIGKLIEGYRGDMRLSADNLGSVVNLQVEHFIRLGGGVISANLEELKARLQIRREELKRLQK
jgi:nucleoside 2-deoxyribosyltransferase